MSAVEMREQVHQMLDKVDDHFLKAVHAMLGMYTSDIDPIEGYDLEGNPMRASELMDKYEAGIEEVKKGNYITVEELREKSKEWLSTTK